MPDQEVMGLNRSLYTQDFQIFVLAALLLSINPCLAEPGYTLPLQTV